jgi:hypothetical protein
MAAHEHPQLSCYLPSKIVVAEAHPHDLPTRRVDGRAAQRYLPVAEGVPVAEEFLDGSCERGRA